MRHFRYCSLLLALVAVMMGAAAQDTVTIDFAIAASPAELAAVEAQVAAFEEANPGIDVVVTALPEYETQLQAAFASGEYPDVFYVGQAKFAEYADAGVLASAADTLDMSGIYQSLQDTFSIDGEVVCPAKDYSLLGLVYNKDMFDAAGLDYPTADWTWDDLLAASTALTTDDVAGITVNPDMDRWYEFYVAAGGKMYDEEGNFMVDEEAATRAAEFFGRLFSEGGAKTSADLGAGWTGEAFGKGQAAMTIEGNWMIGYMLEQFPDINWGAAEIPGTPEGGEGTLTFTVCLGVGADSPDAEKEAAFKLVDFLTNDEGALQVAEQGFGPIPSRPSGADSYVQYWVERFADTGTDAASFQSFIDSAENAVAPILPPGWGAYRDALGNALNELIRGNMDPEDVVEEITEVAGELAEE